MSRGFPSMTALLALLAVAGYQNRDKLAELLRGAGGAVPELARRSGWSCWSATGRPRRIAKQTRWCGRQPVVSAVCLTAGTQ